MTNFLQKFLQWQRRYAALIVCFTIVLSAFAAPRAVKLLSTIKTDLINLLPDDYPTVRYTEEIQKKFNRRSSMYLIIHSPDPEANFKAMMDAKAFLEKVPEVDFISVDKRGFEYIDNNKLLFMELKDLYEIKDKIGDKIEKEKLGGLYIDFENEEGGKEKTLEELIDDYQKDFSEGASSVYRTNKDKTVYVLNIYPKSTDASLGYFKSFGNLIREKAKEFPFTNYHPDMTYGYAGAIITRVDQYEALINDLKVAGTISGLAIFALLYFYFFRFVRSQASFVSVLSRVGLTFVPVLLVFLPMVFSTILAFWFCALFFDQLNVVTSFLFAIIFGLSSSRS